MNRKDGYGHRGWAQRLATIAWLLLLLPSTTVVALDGADVFKKSDEKLIPDICSYSLEINTIGKAGKEKSSIFTGYKRGRDKNVLVSRVPKKLAGSVHLRKQDVIWSYSTINHQLTKVAYQSIFMGTLLNYGDVMATELSFDYDFKEAKEEGKNYIIDLTPKPGRDGYARIEVTINKDTLLPEKRSYYSQTDELLKECTFMDIKFGDGGLKRMVIEFSEPKKERKTLVTFQEVKRLSDVPEKYFNENQIRYLGGE